MYFHSKLLDRKENSSWGDLLTWALVHSFPLPCVGSPWVGEGAVLKKQSPSACPLPRTSPQGSHPCSPIHSLNKILPKPQPWQAPGLSAEADDELCCTGCQTGQWTGRWCKNADEGWRPAEINQLLQHSRNDVVATMAVNAWSLICYCFGGGKLLVEVCLLPSTLAAGDGDFSRHRQKQDAEGRLAVSLLWLLTSI